MDAWRQEQKEEEGRTDRPDGKRVTSVMAITNPIMPAPVRYALNAMDNVAIMRIIHIRTPTQSHPAYLWTEHPIDTEDTEDQVRRVCQNVTSTR